MDTYIMNAYNRTISYKHSFSQHWKFPHIYVDDVNKKISYIYRYMSWKIFMKCIREESFRFVEPSIWPDKFESLFYRAKYNFNGSENIIPSKVYALCTTRERDCEPSWNSYASKEMTIQIKINRLKWLESLNQWNKKDGNIEYKIYEGTINYDVKEAHLAVLSQPTFSINENAYTTSGQGELFSNFDINSYISLLLLKRKAYSYENEIRYFLIPPQDKILEENYFEPKVFNTDIIEEIRYSPKLPKCMFCAMIFALKNKGWKIESQNVRKTIVEKNGHKILIHSFDINTGTYVDFNTPLVINIPKK